MHVYVRVYISSSFLNACVCVCVYIHIYLSVNKNVCVCLYVCVSMCQYENLSIFQIKMCHMHGYVWNIHAQTRNRRAHFNIYILVYTHLSICQYTYLSIYYTYISIYLYMYMSIYLHIWMHIYLSVNQNVLEDTLFHAETRYTRTHTHTHTHTNTHTHTHTHTPAAKCSNQVPLSTLINRFTHDTGWQRLIGSPKSQIIFHKRATKYRALLRKMTYKDKGSYESSPPCTLLDKTIMCIVYLFRAY